MKNIYLNKKSASWIISARESISAFPRMWHSLRSATKKSAFTLSEVLIAVVIIGIVVTLILPSLVKNWEKASSETAIKKFYLELTNAVTTHMAENGTGTITQTPLLYSPEGTDEDVQMSKAKEFLHKYFKIAKDCGANDSGNCLSRSYISANEDTMLAPSVPGYCVLTADGMVTCLRPGDSRPAVVQVDTNGKKGPNQAGYDWFSFSLYYDGSMDEFMPMIRNNENIASALQNKFNRCLSNVGAIYGAGCFSRLIRNGFKIDY